MDELFQSGLELEEEVGEFRQLIQSYVTLSGNEVTALVFTLDRAMERLNAVVERHQEVLHKLLRSEKVSSKD